VRNRSLQYRLVPRRPPAPVRSMVVAAQLRPAASSSASRTQILLGLAGETVLEPVQATANDVLGGRLATGLHIAAVHPHRGRAQKPCLFGRGLIDDQPGTQLAVDPEFGPDPLDQRQRRRVVGAVLDVQDLDHRAPPRPTRRHPLAPLERLPTTGRPLASRPVVPAGAQMQVGLAALPFDLVVISSRAKRWVPDQQHCVMDGVRDSSPARPRVGTAPGVRRGVHAG
jgi:hypothetical protein